MMYLKRIAIGALLSAVTGIAYAGECQNVVSSNLIDEHIAISESKTRSIAPWPFLQLATRCAHFHDWNVATLVGMKEAGNDGIFDIKDPYVSDAHITLSNETYKIDFGRFRNNMSFNSVFGAAAPMDRIPAIQLDEASHAETAQVAVDLLRLTRRVGPGAVYATAYRSDKLFKQKTDFDNSYNLGAMTALGRNAHIELQYDNESRATSSVRQKRLSLFFNLAGSFTKRTKWKIAAESNRFKNRDFIEDNDNTTENYYTEISQENILPALDAYVLFGGSTDVTNQIGGEIGVFLNISDMVRLPKKLTILTGVARASTRFEGGASISTNRYSIQIKYKI